MMSTGNVVSRVREFYYSRKLIWVVFVIGIVLRLRQYLCNRSLWVDEAALAVSLVGRSFSELLLPLKYGQTAPLGFLMTEKLAVVLFGSSEFALRFFPFLVGCISLVLFYRVIVKVLDPQAVPLALGFFAVCQPLVYFSSEVKPYILDVVVMLSLLWLTILFLENPPQSLSRTIFYSIIGALAVWFSFTAIFVLTAMAFVLILHFFRQRQKIFGVLAVIFMFWFVSFMGSYFFVKPQLSPDVDHHLQTFWKNSFMTLAPSLHSLKWHGRTFFYTFCYPGGFALYHLAGLVYLIGIGSFILKRKFVSLVMLLGPIVVTLLASAVHAYPFSDRLILFIVPLLIILITEGALRIKNYLERYHGIFSLAFFVLFCGVPIGMAAHRAIVPITREEARPVLDYVRKFSQSTDTLYIYTRSQKTFDYYSLVKPLPVVAVFGVIAKDNWDAYVQDLKALEGGSRVWVFFSHDWMDSQPARTFTLNYLDRVGRRLDEFVVSGQGAVGLYAQDSSVFLYDLSQPGRQ